MTTGNAPTVEEQIAIQRLNVTACAGETMTEAYRIESAILASLEKLAAIEKPVPVETDPVIYEMDHSEGMGAKMLVVSFKDYSDSVYRLQSALKLAQEELANVDAALSTMSPNSNDTAGRRIVAINGMLNDAWKRAEKAEDTNRRMVELLKEPTQSMITEAWKVSGTPFVEADIRRIFKAMSEQLLKEVEK